MKGRASFADYLIIATASSTRQVVALVDHLVKELKKIGYPAKAEGKNSGADWALVDAGDIVVHIFTSDERKYYALEQLWNGK